MGDFFQLDRATYKQIKSMDKARMNSFLADVYMSGKNDSEGAELDLNALREEIGQIKGVGESRLNEIMNVIEKHLSLENSEESGNSDEK